MLPHCQNWWVPPSRAGACPRRRDAPSTILDVGAGIPAGPGWAMVWARQGCRALRWGYKKGRCPPPAMGWGRWPCGIAAGLRYLQMALWDDGGFRAVRGATGSAAPWTPRFWAARRSLASVVGEEFCVRPRCGGKGPASTTDTRTVGGPHKKKSSKTFIFFFFTGGENPRK